jgi:hypothetical protein
MKPSPETIETLEAIRIEISAGKVLIPRYDAERAHNNACDRAIAIIKNYAEGYGLFQMTKRAKDRTPETDPTVTKKETS